MWIKLDDRFLLNPKVMDAGLHARALYVAGLCYASGELTDGFIPNPAVRKLGVLADVADPERAAERLTEVGLWETCDGGYQIHDFLDWNPTKEHVLEVRRSRAEAGQKGGKQRASNLLSKSQANAKQNSSRSRLETRTQDSLVETSSLSGSASGADAPPPDKDDPVKLKAVPKPDRSREIESLVSAAGIPITLAKRDKDAIKGSGAAPPLIAEAYIAAATGHWGDDWFRSRLSVKAVIDNLAGYQLAQGGKANGQVKNGVYPTQGRSSGRAEQLDAAERQRRRDLRTAGLS
jgi:hypothetical protein